MTSGSGQLMTHKINLNFPQMSEGFRIFYNNETGTCPRVMGGSTGNQSQHGALCMHGLVNIVGASNLFYTNE